MIGNGLQCVGSMLGPVLSVQPSTSDSVGKWVFVAALGLLLIWLLVMPRRLIGQSKQVPPWWKNVRVWAIVVCIVQLWVYWRFG